MDGEAALFAPNLTLTVTLEAGENGATEVHLHPGGQAFWVARMLAHLGVTPRLCGPVGGETGLALTSLIGLWEVELHPVQTSSETPTVIQDRRSGEREMWAETDGHSLDRHTLDDLYSIFLEMALSAGTAVVTGQRSEVVPLEAYRRLGHDLASTDVRVVADLHGDALDAFLEGGGLDVLKVSDEDLASDGALSDDTDEAAVAAVESLAERSSGSVVLSRADLPTVALIDRQIYFAAGPRLEPADFRGAGDSMTAGLVAGLLGGLSAPELLRLGCAAGAANVTRHGLGSGSMELIATLGDKIEVSTSAPVPG